MAPTSIIQSLESLPEGSLLRSVTANPATIGGRAGLRVELKEAVTLNGRPNVDYVDMPTFVVLPVVLEDGTISVDVLSRLNKHAPDYARAFAGLAYRITDACDGFESVYIRPLNGLKVNPPPPRDKRAIQYFSYPDWKFDRLRETAPDGPFEAGLDIGPDEWINLKVVIQGSSVEAFVNERRVLHVPEAKGPIRPGRIGLWVDIGTEAIFSNLTILASELARL